MGTTRQKSFCRNRLQNGPRLLSRVKAGIHTRLRQQDRTQRLTRRNRGVLDRGAITTLGAFHTFRKPCVARRQNGKLCRFWVLVGGTPEGHREPAEQRCAYARRCSAGVAAPLGCVIFLQFGDVAVFSLCAQGFPHMRKRGWYHYPQRALRAAETPDGRLSKRLICRFLRLGSLH